MMNVMELIKFVESSVEGPEQQLNALALLADAPSDDFTMPIRLPVQNEIPAFKLGDNGLGAILTNGDYGTAAPVLGQDSPVTEQSIGDLLTGDFNGA